MIEGFQNPGLAIGAALCVVPLVIHLLNRQRHRPQRWAAMRFVLAAYRKTRRRVQLENLLLLLARMLAVAALAFAIARPFASGDSPLASLREERRDLVLALDVSASTGYRAEVETVFERIVGRADALLDDLDGPRGDRVRLVLIGDRARAFPRQDPEDVRSILDTLDRPFDERADFAGALGEIAEVLEEDRDKGVSSATDVRILTDLQSNSLLGIDAFTSDGEQASGDEAASNDALALTEQLERFEDLDLKVVVEDLGVRSPRPANLSVVSVDVLGERPRTGVPFDVAVSLANHGDEAALQARVALSVGERRLPSKRVDVPARGASEAIFTVVLEESGEHALEASLEGDRLGADDRRGLVIDAPEPLRVLIVNGAPATRIQEDEVGYLTAVLEPPDDGIGGGPGAGNAAANDPFQVEVLPAAELETAADVLESADVIVLANVPPVSRRTSEKLAAEVAAGAALLITLGDRASDLERWAAPLTTDGDASLLPADLLRDVRSVRDSGYYRVAEFDEDHPATAYFADERRRPLLTEVPVYDFIAVRPTGTATVVMELDDAAGSPLLVERPYGEGRVLLWTSTIDHDWNRIPDSGKTFVPLVLELMQYAGTRPSAPRNIEVGEPITVVVPTFPRDATLVLPTGGQVPIEGDARERPDGRWALPEIDGSTTSMAGIYEVRASDLAAEPFSVVLDAAEGDLARATAAEVEAIHPVLVVADSSDLDEGTVDPGAAARQGELWRLLAIAALLFLVFESLWGAYIGHRRKVRP